MGEPKVVHCSIFNPTNAIFKISKSEPAEVNWITCTNSENCDLFRSGKCSMIGVLSIRNCPYGSLNHRKGFTHRARNFYKWLAEQREEFKDVGVLSSPVQKLAFVGDYVFVPYTHADMNEAIPFLSHSSFLYSGSCFIKKEEWTVATIRKIVDFHPYAMMGGEIMSYQRESVPLFLRHLEELDVEMFKKLVAECPTYLEKYNLIVKNYVGRKALLKTLKPPFDFTTSGSREGRYRVKWQWDGKQLKTNSEHAFAQTWAEVPWNDSMEIVLTPTDKTAIVVESNDWVTKETAFID